MSDLIITERKDTEGYERRVPRTIVAAAVLDTETYVVYSMKPPNRHWNIVHAMAEELGLKQVATHEQGFLTSDGYFLRRKMAFYVAEEAGQLKQKTGGADTLYSEDVW